MTDNEIIKALECCATQFVCDGCPLRNRCKDLKPNEFYKIISDLVNRQTAEIERHREHIELLDIEHEAIRNKAIKEFAERLKNKKLHIEDEGQIFKMVHCYEIDNLVKEMVGDTDDSRRVS